MSKADRPAPYLGLAYGPWSRDDGTVRSVWLVAEYRAATDDLRVSYIGKQRGPDFIRHTKDPVRVWLWRTVESFGAVFVGTDTVRPSAPWPRSTPRVDLDEDKITEGIERAYGEQAARLLTRRLSRY